MGERPRSETKGKQQARNVAQARKHSTPALPEASAGSTNPIIRELKSAERVARVVVRDMTSRHLQPGESMASEGVMLEMYGVSRQSLREGLRLLEEQSASVDQIDLVLREAAGFRMGPFELLDLTGLDVSSKVMSSIYEQFQQEPRFRPSS